ncbi:uncharacterized protein FA14DRAFT_169278 [Meira miltonrushii]|uniref:Prokaryotic-type class I peptide chain release factors domain-containing protein n=1 Tax=Meira miltonrushii TaxID=1280837 RepID=A0A316V2M6_9BASI|nr:uncharacterized protein FA14DRAFT_169278 [Meira miltonrushii]PWN31806.1 hypothetical protein FA14DRAFT_169278 [Meira miltonrushii]
MMLIRSCRSISQRSPLLPSLKRYISTVTQYSSSPSATREVPTPLVLLSVPKWESGQEGKTTFKAFINHFTKQGWNVSCIDLDPVVKEDSKVQESSEILTGLESELSQQMRIISRGSGPFPPMLVSYGLSTLVAEQYVSSHPLSALALLNPPISPSHAHKSHPDIFPNDLAQFTYEPTFPILIARTTTNVKEISYWDMHRIEEMQEEEADEALDRRIWELNDEGEGEKAGPYQLRLWAEENGIKAYSTAQADLLILSFRMPPQLPEWFTKGKYVRNDRSNKREPLILDDSHLEESFIRGSGPGGQAINKLSTCVRLKHVPTETIVKCQDTRSREQNRDMARRKMGQLLERVVFGERDSVLGREALRAKNQKRVKERKRKKKTAARKEKKERKRIEKIGVVHTLIL